MCVCTRCMWPCEWVFNILFLSSFDSFCFNWFVVQSCSECAVSSSSYTTAHVGLFLSVSFLVALVSLFASST
eukprot:m.102431 g.102431  ORF g.102431 m.102431 type:complete len:72 (+) comp12592_c1_seq4:1714-1929(+)